MVFTPKFYFDPFAVDGDVAAIPDLTQPDGSVSYQSGFPVDYSLNKNTNPSAKAVPRQQFNQLMFDVTANIQQYWMHGVPEFITSANNGGTAYTYSAKDRCRFTTSDNVLRIFECLNTTTDMPYLGPSTPSANWQELGYILTASGGGSANALLIFSTVALTGISQFGTILNIRVTTSNTGGSCTVTIGSDPSEANWPVKVWYQGSLINPLAGMILSGAPYQFFWTGGNYILLNPTAVETSDFQDLFCQISFTAGGSDTVAGNTFLHPIAFDGTATGQTAWWTGTAFNPNISGNFILTGSSTFNTVGANAQYLLAVKNSTTVLYGNLGYGGASSQFGSIVLPNSNNFFMNGTSDICQAMWSNSTIGSPTVVGDNAGFSYRGNILSSVKLQYVGQ